MYSLPFRSIRLVQPSPHHQAGKGESLQEKSTAVGSGDPRSTGIVFLCTLYITCTLHFSTIFKAIKGSSQWVGCVAVDMAGDWLVCGGSFSPTIYHLSTLSKITAMDVPKEVVTQTAIFAKDRVSTNHNMFGLIS